MNSFLFVESVCVLVIEWNTFPGDDLFNFQPSNPYSVCVSCVCVSVALNFYLRRIWSNVSGLSPKMTGNYHEWLNDK